MMLATALILMVVTVALDHLVVEAQARPPGRVMNLMSPMLTPRTTLQEAADLVVVGAHLVLVALKPIFFIVSILRSVVLGRAA